MRSSSLRCIALVLLLIQAVLGAEEKKLRPTIVQKNASSKTADQRVSLSAESDPSAFIGNVNTIFGNLLLASTDLIQPGPVPLHFTRYYDSSRNGYLWLGAGMTCNYPFWIQGIPGENGNWDKVMVEEDCGSIMTYDGALNPLKSSSKFYLSHEVIYGGLTNTSKEEVSGRTNSKNSIYQIKVKFHKGKQPTGIWKGIVCDGTEREYLKNWDFDEYSQITEAKKPSGQRLLYEYTNRTWLLKEIKATDHDKRNTFGKLKFDYGKKKTTITAANGKKVVYSHSHTVSGMNLVRKLPRIDAIHSPDQPYTKYSYTKINHHPVISEIQWPNGRFLRIKYDKRGRVIQQKAPHGQNGQEITTYRFEYDSKNYRTSAWDALKRRTLYTYSCQNRPKSIRKYDSHDKLYRRISFVWGSAKSLTVAKKDTSDEGNLLAKSIRDGSDRVLSTHCYSYDNDGNISKETLYGNLSGKGKKLFSIDSKGRPEGSSVEGYTKRYTYSKDAFHLRLSESEDNGPTIQYTYKKGTDLLEAKLTYNGKSIIQREFYSYNKDAVVVKSIVDDGRSSDPNDVRGVTQRHITKITPVSGRSDYGVGQPAEIREYYYDPQSKQEILLGKRAFEYTREGLPREERVYDNTGAYRYTLHTSYNANGLPVRRIDALGREQLFSYDENFNKIREELVGSGVYTIYHYDKANRCIKEEEYHSDGKVLTTSYTYDAVGNKTSHTDPFGNTTHYQYDDFNRLIAVTSPPIHMKDGSTYTPVVRKSYDVLNNIVQEIDGNGNITHMQNTIRGKPYHITYPDGSYEKFEFNLNGTLAIHWQRNGTRTEYSYDILDRVTKEKNIDAQGNTLSTKKMGYSTFQKTSSTDPMGYTTNYIYDGAGRLIETKKEANGTWERTTYHYDSLNRLHTTREWADAASFIATIQEKDLLDRVIEERVESSDGTILSRKKYAYDIRGNLTHEISYTSQQEAYTTYTEFNTENFPVFTRDAMGNETRISYNNHYVNALGQKVLEKTTTDPLGNKTIEISDAHHRIASIEKKSAGNILLARTQFFYDGNGNKTAQKESVVIDGTVAREYSIEWSYTNMDQVAVQTEQPRTTQQKTTSYNYTKSGLIHTITKPSGVRLIHSYDGLSRLTSLVSSDGGISYTYSYDLNNNPIRIVDNRYGLTYQYRYDAWDNKVKDCLFGGIQPTVQYDRLGRAARYVLPNRLSVEYSYDRNGHLNHIARKDSFGNELYRHSYLTFDHESKVLSSQLIQNTGTAQYAWDGLGRNVSINTPYWSESIPGHGFDKAGNLKLFSITDQAGQATYSYEYDSLYQLIQEQGPFQSRFKNDSINNRLKKDESDYHINALNQLTSDSATSLSYDADGNPIEIRNGDLTLTLAYDALDRLVAVEKPGTFRYEYLYDSSHRRLRKKWFQWNTASQSWQEQGFLSFIFFNNREIGAIDSNNNLIEFRTLGLGKGAELGASVAIELNSSIYCPIHDHRGNISALVDTETRQTAEFYRFSAFGEEQLFDGSGALLLESSNPWRFVSKRYDPETGFLFFGRRYYSSSFGRFLTPDPVGFSDGPNLYAYVHNSPMVLIDPYGLTATENAQAAGNGIKEGLNNAFNNHSEMWSRNLNTLHNFGRNLAAGDLSPYRNAWNSSTSSELIQAGTQRAVELGVMAWDVSSLYGIGRAALAHGPTLLRSSLSTIKQGVNAGWKAISNKWGSVAQQVAPKKLVNAAQDVGKVALKQQATEAARVGSKEIIKRSGDSNGFLGHRGWELKNAPYQLVRNEAKLINNRQFTKHALDQMQNRGIMPSVVENTIKQGKISADPLIGRTRYYDPVNNITAILEDASNSVITVITGKR